MRHARRDSARFGAPALSCAHGKGLHQFGEQIKNCFELFYINTTCNILFIWHKTGSRLKTNSDDISFTTAFSNPHPRAHGQPPS
jgi:hypothetical protein